jgi:hypothetical protein
VLREIHYAKGEGRHIAPWASKGRKNMQAGRQAGRQALPARIFVFPWLLLDAEESKDAVDNMLSLPLQLYKESGGDI